MTKLKHGIRTLVAVACAGIFSYASAHPLLMPVSDHHGPYYRGEPIDQMLFSLQESEGSPKLWTEMTPQERAEIWPFLSPKMQRYYWRSMTEPERRSMRAHLPPSVNEKFRKRYASPAGKPPPPGDSHYVKHRLSPAERAQMRQQIREMHIEFYRFRLQRPPVVAEQPPAEPPTPPPPPAPPLP